MTISTVKGNPYSLSFMFFNLIAYSILGFLFRNFLTNYKSAVVVYTIITLLAVVTSFIYISIGLYFTHRLEEKIMRNCNYTKELGCVLFMRSNPKYILKLNKESFELYINRMYLTMFEFSVNGVDYISKLKSRFAKLNKVDILLIYIYKYASTSFMSVMLFTAWYNSGNITIGDGPLIRLLSIVIILCISISMYFMITKIWYIYITKILKQRNLEFFITN